MADSFIIVPPDSTGKYIDTTALTVGANTVQRERMNIADPTSATAIAAVKDANIAAVASDPAFVVAISPNNALKVLPGTPSFGETSLTNINTASSGWTQLVPSVVGQTVRLMRLIVSVAGTTNIEIGDGTNVFLGPWYLTANGSVVLDISGEPWAITGVGAALQIQSSNAVSYTTSAWTTQS